MTRSSEKLNKVGDIDIKSFRSIFIAGLDVEVSWFVWMAGPSWNNVGFNNLYQTTIPPVQRSHLQIEQPSHFLVY